MARNLKESEIALLKGNGCSAENWNHVKVSDPFLPERMSQVTLQGRVLLGSNAGTLKVNGVEYPCGVRNALLADCTVGDDAVIRNIGTHIARYTVESGAAVLNTAELTAHPGTTFGLGTVVEAVNESGGREVPLSVSLSAQIAYLLVAYRFRPGAVKALAGLLLAEADAVKGRPGLVGRGARVLNSGVLTNVWIGPAARVSGALSLTEGTLESCPEDPVVVGEGVSASHFVIMAGGHVTSGAILQKALVGEGARIGKQFSAENCLFFANAEAFHGEAVSIFAGPFSVTHHKSTLLIASLYSFYNAGSGTNHSNHMYKLGPVHQGVLERGCKTGSFSYLLLESRLAPFCVVIGKHMVNIDIPDFPFSYVSESGGKSHLTPAMNLLTVGTVRDQEKWASRDRRKAPVKKDIINPAAYSPYTIERMIRGRDRLARLYETTAKDVESVNVGGVILSRLLMKNGAKHYNMTIQRWLYQKLFVRIEEKLKAGLPWREALLSVRPGLPAEADWCDIGGLLCPGSEIEKLLKKLEAGGFHSAGEVRAALQEIHGRFAEHEFSYAFSRFEKEKGVETAALTREAACEMIEDWQALTRKIFNLVIADAEKEFDDFARIGFGLNGNEDDAAEDFEAVRGSRETNKVLVKMRQNQENFMKAADELKVLIMNSD